jgi:hypothetical protein
MLTAATSSLERGWGAILGLSWPVAGGIVGGAAIDFGTGAIPTAIHDFIWTAARLIPFTYASIPIGVVIRDNLSVRPLFLPAISLPVLESMGAEVLLILLYGTLAIVQWRRAEA